MHGPNAGSSRVTFQQVVLGLLTASVGNGVETSIARRDVWRIQDAPLSDVVTWVCHCAIWRGTTSRQGTDETRAEHISIKRALRILTFMHFDTDPRWRVGC